MAHEAGISTAIRQAFAAIVLAAGLGTCWVGSAGATVLFNNVDPTSVAGQDAVRDNGPLGNSFTVGSSGSIQQISLMLSNPGGSNAVTTGNRHRWEAPYGRRHSARA